MSKKTSIKLDKNVTWNLNHELIKETYISLIKKLSKAPTVAMISNECNISETTIKKHISEIEFKPVQSLTRLLTDNVILSIYKTAMSGNVAAQRLFLQLVEGWTEKSEIDLTFKKSIRDLMEEDETETILIDNE